ncbi:MAG: thymidine phosphorylase [archaeon]
MKLKIKNFNWLAGRPVAILNDRTAKKINVFVNDRIAITNSKKIYAVTDIFSKLVKENELGVSQELSSILKLKNKSVVEVSVSELSDASHLIKKKLSGQKLNKQEITFLISEIVHNNLTEAEIAFFTAAEKISGMDLEETINLTKAMTKTGSKLKFKEKYVADKHCIGGISGNRTTPIVVAICAAAGLILPKTSSRAITSASGTADVIETISNVELSIKEIKKVVSKTGACLTWGGSLGLAPSDDKIIQVERLLNLDIEPQLIASIMSKKIAAGAKYILIDIPYGKGGKVNNLTDAKKLGRKFEKVGKIFRLKLKVIYTDGSQPIGNGIGPVLELLDVLRVLQNKRGAPEDLREKSLLLSSELISLCGIKNSRQKVEEILSSGKAYEKFKEIINAQNKKNDFDKRIENLKLGKFKKIIKAKKSGKIISIDNNKINSLCRILGTPETKSAGVYLHNHVGEIKKHEPVLTLYSESRNKLKDGLKFIKEFEPIRPR